MVGDKNSNNGQGLLSANKQAFLSRPLFFLLAVFYGSKKQEARTIDDNGLD